MMLGDVIELTEWTECRVQCISNAVLNFWIEIYEWVVIIDLFCGEIFDSTLDNVYNFKGWTLSIITACTCRGLGNLLYKFITIKGIH